MIKYEHARTDTRSLNEYSVFRNSWDMLSAHEPFCMCVFIYKLMVVILGNSCTYADTCLLSVGSSISLPY